MSSAISCGFPQADATRAGHRPVGQRALLVLRLLVFSLLGFAFVAPSTMEGQGGKHPAGSIQISFLPPPLENATYSLGIFDAKTKKMVRRLQEFASEKDFTVGLNGLITAWDGKDDSGKAVPPGRYAARGYAVGPLKIEGEDILDNDWAADNEKLRPVDLAALALVSEDEGLVVLGRDAGDRQLVARYGGEKDELLWQQIAVTPGKENSSAARLFTLDEILVASLGGPETFYRLADGKITDPVPTKSVPGMTPTTCEGKDGTIWKVEEGILTQSARSGERLRSLDSKSREPVPVAVVASKTSDRLYLLEKMPGWQRVRGLSWVETKEENGHPVSTWQTFFERNIRAPGTGGDLEHPAAASTAPVEINLDENPLAPGKTQKLGLIAAFDAKGSYLATKDGLRLRQVSERPNLESAYLAKGKPPSPVAFFQYDGAATDEFSIKGIHRIMEFDAGEFEMTANGEKPVEAKPTEPPDL